MPCLGAPHELPSLVNNVANGRAHEADVALRRSCLVSSQLGFEPKQAKPLQKPIAEQAIGGIKGRRETLSGIGDNAVGEIVLVQYRPAARYPANDVKTELSASIEIDGVALLKIAEGNGGRAPLVEAQRRW